MRHRSLSTPFAVARAPGRRAVWVVVALAVVTQLVVLARIRLASVNSVGGDLCQDIASIHRALRGQNPYGVLSECGVLSYSPHPPVSLLVMFPFAWLPPAPAGLLWDLVGLGMVALSVALIVAELRVALRPARLALMLGLLIFWPPLLDTLLEAQMSTALLLLLTLAWLWRRRDLPELAGAALGLAAALRLFPALAALYLLLRRDWRTLKGMVASFLAASALALLLVGPTGSLSFLFTATPRVSATWGHSAHNISLWGLADHLAPRSAAGGVGFALVAVYLGLLVARAWRRRALSARADEATFLLCYPAMLLVSPLGWQYYFLALLAPILLIAREVGGLGRPTAAVFTPRVKLFTEVLLGVFLAAPWLYKLPMLGTQSGTIPLALTIPTLALLALSLALAWLPSCDEMRAVKSVPEPR